MIDRNFLLKSARDFGIELDETALRRFELYGEFLVEYNEKVNLTAITDDTGVAEKHFLDSLLLFSAAGKAETVADVGSGAGFPGVPYLIHSPDTRFTAIEPNGKRVAFLEQLSEKLDLPFSAVHIRAEEAGTNPDYREKFQLVSARAVKELRELSELCLPLVKAGGIFAALKGPDGEAEAAGAKNAIRLLGGEIKEIKSYTLPSGSERKIILIKKISQTPTKYPRMYSKIKKSPL